MPLSDDRQATQSAEAGKALDACMQFLVLLLVADVMAQPLIFPAPLTKWTFGLNLQPPQTPTQWLALHCALDGGRHGVGIAAAQQLGADGPTRRSAQGLGQGCRAGALRRGR